MSKTQNNNLTTEKQIVFRVTPSEHKQIRIKGAGTDEGLTANQMAKKVVFEVLDITPDPIQPVQK